MLPPRRARRPPPRRCALVTPPSASSPPSRHAWCTILVAVAVAFDLSVMPLASRQSFHLLPPRPRLLRPRSARPPATLLHLHLHRPPRRHQTRRSCRGRIPRSQLLGIAISTSDLPSLHQHTPLAQLNAARVQLLGPPPSPHDHARARPAALAQLLALVTQWHRPHSPLLPPLCLRHVSRRPRPW
jgi:hypothetical protein